MAWSAYRLIAPCVGAIAPAAGVFGSKAERALWHERLGAVQIPGGCDAWIHAASLGEAVAVGPLARELRSLATGATFQLTANTRTGRAPLAGLGDPVSLAPLDAPQAVNRFFGGVRPRRLLVIETELWPHWLMRARRDGVPVAMVSARLSSRSVERYRALGARFRELIGGIAAVLCQSEEDRRRWLEVGANPARTEVVGNLKDDALPRPAASRETERATRGLEAGRPLFVMGSVRPGEVRVLARAWRSLSDDVRRRWQAVAVPRHPRASAELREEATRAGMTLVREGAPTDGAWRWDDGVGVLAGYYAAADLVFVGGSLAPYGGHNPIEPAACGAPVVMGPHHATQVEGVRALRERDAIEIVATPEELGSALAALMTDDARRATRGAKAREVAEERRGAARRAVHRLAQWELWPPR